MAQTTVVRIRLASIDAVPIVDTLLVDYDTLSATLYHKFLLFYPVDVGCNNRWYLGVQFGPYSGRDEYEARLVLEPDGSLHVVKARPDLSCQERFQLSPVRVDDDSTSGVRMALPDTVVLRVRLGRRSPSTHTTPGITMIGSKVVCAWRVKDTADWDVLARWDRRVDTVGPAFTYVPPAPERSLPYTARDISATETMDNRIVPLPGDIALRYYQQYYATFEYNPVGSGYYRWYTFDSRVALARADTGRWSGVDTVRAGTGWSSNIFITTGTIVGYDPDDGLIVSAITSFAAQEPGNVRGRWVRGHRRDGKRWEIAWPFGVTEKSHVIPIGTRRYVLIGTERGLFMDSNRVVDTFSVPNIGSSSVRYMGLRGPLWGRSLWTAADSSTFLIESFDTSGRRLNTTALRRSRMTEDYMVVQSSFDSSLAILFGGEDGLHCTLLNKDLTIRVEDTVVSATRAVVAHPAGAFGGDTLFCVWGDSREGIGRIYGNMLPLHPSLPSDTGDDDRSPRDPHDSAVAGLGNSAFRVFPNPTNGEVSVTGTLGGTVAADLDVATPLGQIVARYRIVPASNGTFKTEIDVRGLPTGTYIIRLRDRMAVVVRRIVKW